MKKMYFLLINIKLELLKLLCCILLIICSPLLVDAINSELNNKYSCENILYISILMYIAIFIIVISLVSIEFNRFIRRSWESLTLLGVTVSCNILLFLLLNYEFLFMQIYFGMMIYRIRGIENGVFTALTNLVNTALTVSFGIILGLKLYSKNLMILVFAIAGIMGIMLGKDVITYASAYNLIMSDALKNIIFSDNIIFLMIKSFILVYMMFAIVKLYSKTDIDGTFNLRGLHMLNFAGDLLHKFSGLSIYEKNYFWLYRNKEFVFWKIFSTLFLVIICCIKCSNIAIFILSYVICLITSFYFCDIYNFERNHFLIFYMSEYSYKQLISDLTIGGLFVLGDNVLPILLFNCINNPSGVFILISTVMSILVLTVFVNSGIFKDYPIEKYNISVFLVLIKLHIPILNVFFLYKCFKDGKRNWENLVYENEKCSDY